MNVHINVNDLIQQITQITKESSKAIFELEQVKKELQIVKENLVVRETEDLKKKIDFEKNMNEMAAEYEKDEFEKINKVFKNYIAG